MPALPATVTTLLVPLFLALDDLDPTPEPEDVKAGYPALFMFLGLLLVIGLLGWSLSRHLRRADDNRKAGIFGDAPEEQALAERTTGEQVVDGQAPEAGTRGTAGTTPQV